MDEEIKELQSIIEMFESKELNAKQKKILLSLNKIKRAMQRQDIYIIQMEKDVEKICRSNINKVIEVDNLRSRLLRLKFNK